MNAGQVGKRARDAKVLILGLARKRFCLRSTPLVHQTCSACCHPCGSLVSISQPIISAIANCAPHSLKYSTAILQILDPAGPRPHQFLLDPDSSSRPTNGRPHGPIELIYTILALLPPPDLGSFYCINRTIYALTAIHRIGHQRLKRLYAVRVQCDHYQAQASLIRDFLKDPEPALYIQRWTLGAHCRCKPSLNCAPADEIVYTDAEDALLREKIQQCAFIPASEKSTWIECVHYLTDDSISILAILLCPNLTSLEIHSNLDKYYDRVTNLVESMMTTCPTRSLDDSALLSSLVRVDLGCANDSSEPESIEIFARLESLRLINAFNVYDPGTNLASFKPLATTKVTSLNISHGDIAPQRLMLLLEGFTSLQSFSYWLGGVTGHSRHPFEPLVITRALLDCAQNSLRELRFRAPGAAQAYMGSVRRFGALEYLETDTTLLLGDAHESIVKVEDSLPNSIQAVKLFDGKSSTWHDDRCTDIVRQLIEAKAALVPELRTVEWTNPTFQEEVKEYAGFILTSRNREPASLPDFTIQANRPYQ